MRWKEDQGEECVECDRDNKTKEERRRWAKGKEMRADGKRGKRDKYLQLKQQVNDLLQFVYLKKKMNCDKVLT